ncbi:MAG: hypothetical protein WC852_05820 [Candidatus Nanoarchaeia archaeon]|jgi:hypothetical protein
MKHYVKCTYRDGLLNGEKAVMINTPDDERKTYELLAWDSEVVVLDSRNSLIEIVSGYPIDDKNARVALREQGYATYFTVPLEDIVEKNN